MSLPCGRDLHVARRAGLDPERRVLRSRVAEGGPRRSSGAGGEVPSWRRDAHGDGLRLHLHLEGLDLAAIAAVELVQDLRSSLTLIFRALVTRTNGDLSGWPIAVRASVRAQSPIPSAFTTPISSCPSSGFASAKTSMPPNRWPTLPTRMQLALPCTTSLRRSRSRREGLRPETLRCRPDVGGASEAVLEVPVGLLDHRRVEAPRRPSRRSARR